MSIANLLVPNNLGIYIDDAIITGNIVPQTTNTVDIGNSSTRFKNIYTYDIYIQNSKLIVNTGPNTRTITITSPAADDTMTTNAAAQTLTNKTLTSPTINTPTITGASATFTTTGGTPATLSYYEGPYTHSTTWSGPFASPAAGDVIVYRIGNIVTAQFPVIQVAATVNTVMVSTLALPARFRPSVAVFNAGIIAYNNSANVQGRLQIDTSGIFTVAVGPTGASFTAAGLAGIGGTYVCSWFV